MFSEDWTKELDAKIVFTENVARAIRLITEVFGYNSSGGNLHSIIDDFNFYDEMFKGDMYIHYDDYEPWRLKTEQKLYNLLKNMSYDERATAIFYGTVDYY